MFTFEQIAIGVITLLVTILTFMGGRLIWKQDKHDESLTSLGLAFADMTAQLKNVIDLFGRGEVSFKERMQVVEVALKKEIAVLESQVKNNADEIKNLREWKHDKSNDETRSRLSEAVEKKLDLILGSKARAV